MKNVLKKIAIRYGFLFVLLMVFTGFSTVSINADTTYKVRQSDSLDRIVRKFYVDRSLSKSQIILEIFNNNPTAFKRGNINSLILGADLQLPDESSMTAYLGEEAGEALNNNQEQQANEAKQTNAGSDFSLSELVRSIQNNIQDDEARESNKELEASQKKQSLEIKKLEEKGDQLRRQLEQLLSEKKQRDKKLIELESAMKDSLNEETKSKPVINSNSTEPLIADAVVNNSNKNNVNNSSLSSSSEQVKNVNTSSSAISTVEISGNKDEEFKEQNLKQGQKNSIFSKWIWLIPLLLIFGYLLKSLLGKDKSRNTSYDEVLETEGLNPEIVDTHFEQQPLETIIKLDVAKAYIDLNDKESARSLLKEIVKKGDAKLKVEAKTLLDLVA